MKVWIDGLVCDEHDARISPFDHGLLVGNGVFETVKSYGGKPFAMRRHLERLERSADGMGLEVPPPEVLRQAVDEVLAANALTGEARVRITVTGGRGPLGSARGDDDCLVIVAASEQPPWPADAAVAVTPWPRNERSPLAGLKTTSYGENVVALAWAKERGASEAIFGNLAGNLCEGTGTNVFLGVNGRLLTPTLSSGCLAGVTRALILEVVHAVEEDVPLAALAEADEAFLSSTTREVHPISTVDGKPLKATPGPLTKAAAAAFANLVAHDLDP